MDHKVSTLYAFPTLSVCICHIVRIQKWLAFPRNPQLPAALEHSDILYICIHFKAFVYGAKICIAQSYRLKVPDGEPRICLDWLIICKMFFSLEVSCWSGLAVRLVWPLGYKILYTYEPRLSVELGNPHVFCYISIGPSAKPLPC